MNSYMLDFPEMLTLARLAWNAMCFYDERWLGFINPNEEKKYSVDTLMHAMVSWTTISLRLAY